MAEKRVMVFHPGQGSRDTAQTAGMEREQLVASADAWVGMARTAPGFVSGWHHHGDFDTYVYVVSGAMQFESGKEGVDVSEAGPGDVVHVPRQTVHKESNPSAEEQVVFVVRVGRGTPVTNVEGPEE